MAVQRQVEQKCGIGQVDLVDVVVDRLAGPSREVGDGEAVAGEARAPAAAVEAGHILHQVDFVDPRRVANLQDRPDEHTLGPILALLGAEEDPHRRQR